MTDELYTMSDNINIQDDSLSVKPAFGYYGAKQKISSSIVELLPPHNAWVEVFCGSAAITLAKPPAQIEVINDLDSTIVNLFDQLLRIREMESRLESIDGIIYLKEFLMLLRD